MSDDFYIGYLDRSPTTLSRHTRGWVWILALVVVGLTAFVAARQAPAEPGTFEFGIQRTFEGVLYETPLPVLRSVSAEGAVTNHLLVGAGKHGLPGFARGHGGERVRFQGSLIQRGAASMIELNDGRSFTVISLGQAEPRPAKELLGPVVLRGELVDTKCYFGVMRPATGKVHRGCAVRCLSGGVPPGLLVRDGRDGATVVMLSAPGGTPLTYDVQWAARWLEVSGTLFLEEGTLRVEVDSLQLLE
jgi:hypothetical protein